MGNNNQLQQIYIEKTPIIIDQESLPNLISNQVDQIEELGSKVKFAMSAAKSAKQSALEASGKSAGFGKKKVAIEELQSAQLDIAKAIESSAEAQNTSFEFQRKLVEISKSLFALGANNIANNRMIVRELEKRLQGASEEEISELAKQELMQVLAQLKAQEDIINKLENNNSNILQLRESLVKHFDYSRELNEKVFEHKFSIEKQEEIIEGHGRNIERLSTFTQEQIQRNTKSTEKFEGIDKQLSNIAKHNKTFSNHISQQEKLNNMIDLEFKNIQNHIQLANQSHQETQNQLQLLISKDEEFNQLIKFHQATDEELTEKMAKQALQIKESNTIIQQLKSENHLLTEQLNMKSSNKFTKVTFGLALLGTITAIVGLFI